TTLLLGALQTSDYFGPSNRIKIRWRALSLNILISFSSNLYFCPCLLQKGNPRYHARNCASKARSRYFHDFRPGFAEHEAMKTSICFEPRLEKTSSARKAALLAIRRAPLLLVPM